MRLLSWECILGTELAWFGFIFVVPTRKSNQHSINTVEEGLLRNQRTTPMFQPPLGFVYLHTGLIEHSSPAQGKAALCAQLS